MKLKIFFILQFLCLLKNVLLDKPKIAIIGSGIGGSSCAYFLKEYLGDAADIDLYEADKIGGRLATVEYAGASYETGGCVIHQRNKYMDEFRKKFQLKKNDDDADGRLGIYDKNGLEFLSSYVKMVTYAKMVWRYGYSLFRLHSFIENMLDSFDKIYKLQKQGKAFETVEELFAEADPNFLEYFNTSSIDGFSHHAKINEKTINELVKGSLRVNYGQNTKVHLFVGSVSVAGMFGNLWSIKGGNKQVPELLVKQSEVNFLKNMVIKITFDKKNKKYTVESFVVAMEKKKSVSYDVVILANPITSDSRTPIKFINFSKPISVSGKYHRTVATLVSGHLNGSFYGLPENDDIDIIVNTNEDDFICSVGRLHPVSKMKKYDRNVWKIFSRRPLTTYELDRLFQKHEIILVNDWLAYPEYENLNLSSKFVLHDRLYYVNAIEWAASAMEMSVIGAKNVALLVRNELLKDDVKNHRVKVNYQRVEL